MMIVESKSILVKCPSMLNKRGVLMMRQFFLGSGMKMKILKFVLCVASVGLLASGARAQTSAPSSYVSSASQ